jgi:putative transposase
MFKYRLYPTKEQRRLLEQQLEECRWLYNRLLEERQRAWEERQESVRLFDLHRMLPLLKAERPTLTRVQSQVLQNVAVRIDLAFQAFFRRCKAGEEPGYPRFRGKGRYDSFTSPQVPVGCHLDAEAKRLRVMHVGLVKLIPHRPLEGTPKTATISRSSTGKWYVCFSCECAEPSPLPATGAVVGIDVGLKTFAILSTGQEVANPRFFRQEERALARVQRAHSKRTKGTPERATHRKVVARVHERTRWRRTDFSHQHSRRIVNQFDLLAVEDLSVHRMMYHQCLANSIHDAAWCQFTALLAYKAVGAGREHGAVNPAYTSQDCSRCRHRQTLSLADRLYTCPCCGLVLDRDLNASRNTLRLGQQSRACILGSCHLCLTHDLMLAATGSSVKSVLADGRPATRLHLVRDLLVSRTAAEDACALGFHDGSILDTSHQRLRSLAEKALADRSYVHDPWEENGTQYTAMAVRLTLYDEHAASVAVLWRGEHPQSQPDSSLLIVFAGACALASGQVRLDGSELEERLAEEKE